MTQRNKSWITITRIRSFGIISKPLAFSIIYPYKMEDDFLIIYITFYNPVSISAPISCKIAYNPKYIRLRYILSLLPLAALALRMV